MHALCQIFLSRSFDGDFECCWMLLYQYIHLVTTADSDDLP